MTELAILLMLACPTTKMINPSGLPWTKWDYNRKEYCSRHCIREYSDNPCLTRFVKTSFQTYYCECGKIRR